MKSRIAPLFRRLPNGSRTLADGLLAFALLALCGSAGAQVSFTGVYTENFNGMGTSGTAAPTGWGFYGNLGGDNNTWVSSIPAADAGLGTLNATLIASTSNTVTSNTQGYNRADSGSTADRCLASSPTSGRGVVWQLSLSNLTGAPVNTLGMRYDTRRFNAPLQRADQCQRSAGPPGFLQPRQWCDLDQCPEPQSLHHDGPEYDRNFGLRRAQPVPCFGLGLERDSVAPLDR